MAKIIKQVSLVLTEEEINSPDPIEIRFHVHSEADPDNEEGVTYTIKYPKNDNRGDLLVSDSKVGTSSEDTNNG